MIWLDSFKLNWFDFACSFVLKLPWICFWKVMNWIWRIQQKILFMGLNELSWIKFESIEMVRLNQLQLYQIELG